MDTSPLFNIRLGTIPGKHLFQKYTKQDLKYMVLFSLICVQGYTAGSSRWDKYVKKSLVKVKVILLIRGNLYLQFFLLVLSYIYLVQLAHL